MKRPAQNLLVDAVALVAFVLLAATGTLLEFVLPHGRGGDAIWGLSRHDWGAVHFWIAVVFLTTIAVHFVLHWQWITCMVKGRPADGPQARRRVALTLGGGAVLLLLALAPLLSPVTRGTTPGGGHGQGRAAADDAPAVAAPESSAPAPAETAAPAPVDTPADAPARRVAHAPEDDPYDLRGSMTLAEVAERTGVPAADLADRLGLPADVPTDARLGVLRRTYGFTMRDVREAVPDAGAADERR